jgi:hypothetical protein
MIKIGSGGSDNLIILDDKDIAIKIIPKKINPLLIKQLNNDYMEAEFYKKFTEEFIKPNKTPHIVGLYKRYILEDLKFIFPPKCPSFDDVLLNPNIDESNILLAIILATKTTHTTDLLIERFNELSKNTNLSKQSLIQINDFLDRTYVNDVLDIVLKNNKDIVEKITDCKNEKKIKKLMTSIRNKCKFDRKVDEKIIMDQIYHTTMYFIV